MGSCQKIERTDSLYPYGPMVVVDGYFLPGEVKWKFCVRHILILKGPPPCTTFSATTTCISACYDATVLFLRSDVLGRGSCMSGRGPLTVLTFGQLRGDRWESQSIYNPRAPSTSSVGGFSGCHRGVTTFSGGSSRCRVTSLEKGMTCKAVLQGPATSTLTATNLRPVRADQVQVPGGDPIHLGETVPERSRFFSPTHFLCV